MTRTGFGLQDTWKAMEKLVSKGLVKNIGVSNFNISILNDLLNYCTIKPVTNQVERNPYLTQPELKQFCEDNDILLTAYSSLGSSGHKRIREEVLKDSLFDNKIVIELAKKYKKTVAQILIRWSIDSNCITIPKSKTPSRQLENFVTDFKLDTMDVNQLNNLNKNKRMFKFEIFLKNNLFK